MTIENEIQEAYQFLRKENSTIPSETLEFIRDAALLLAREGVVRREDVTPRRGGIGSVSVVTGHANANKLAGQPGMTVIFIPNGGARNVCKCDR